MLKAGVKQILFSFGCAAYGAPATVPIRENQPKLLALRHLLSGGASAELNLGTGRGHSVKEVVSAVERTSGQRIVTRTADQAPWRSAPIGCGPEQCSFGLRMEAPLPPLAFDSGVRLAVARSSGGGSSAGRRRHLWARHVATLSLSGPPRRMGNQPSALCNPPQAWGWIGRLRQKKLWAHPITHNLLAISLVQAGNNAVPLLTVPYLARVLGPDGWGLFGFAQSFAISLGLVRVRLLALGQPRDRSPSGRQENAKHDRCRGHGSQDHARRWGHHRCVNV